MIRKLTTIAALAAAVMLAPAPQLPAHALTGLGTAPALPNGVIQVRHGGHIGGVHMGGGHFRGGGVRFHGLHAGGVHIRPHGFRGRHFYGGPAFAYAPYRRHRFYGGYYPYVYGGAYYGGGNYGGGCYWLKVRAIETGSPYWWERYEDCVD
jgi:hypothetical protein